MSSNTRPVIVSGRAGWFSANSPARMIADRRAFRTHGSLSGRMIRNGDALPVGQLPDDYARRLLVDVRNYGPVFVVFSYATPIAWIDANGDATIPDVKYSVTTTRHQHTARMGMAVATGEYDRPAEWDAS